MSSIDARIVDTADATPIGEPSRHRVLIEVEAIADGSTPSVLVVPVGGTHLLDISVRPRPTDAAMATAIEQAADGGRVLATALDALGLRDTADAWAAAGCPIVGE